MPPSLDSRPVVTIVAVALVATGACSGSEMEVRGRPEPVPTEATVFARGSISTESWQYRITFSPDGTTAYFTVAESFFPAARSAAIYEAARRQDGSWDEPQVASFSGTYADIDPFVTPDGRRLYFSSIRPDDRGPRADLDLFYMDRLGDGWGEPVRMGPEINTTLDELYASADTFGNLYFASGPAAPVPGIDWNIYTARRTQSGFHPRVPVQAVNTRREWNPDDPTWDWEFNPEVSRDGRTLLFASLRPGGFGRGDIYVSLAAGGEWSEPVNLGPLVNTSNDEFHPTLSPDGSMLFFARTVFDGEVIPSDFYSIPTALLPALQR